MESSDRNAVKARLSSAAIALAYASTHLRNVTEKSATRSIFSRQLPNAAGECLFAQERINEAHQQIEELTTLLVPPPPSFEERADVFRRAIASNVLATS